MGFFQNLVTEKRGLVTDFVPLSEELNKITVKITQGPEAGQIGIILDKKTFQPKDIVLLVKEETGQLPRYHIALLKSALENDLPEGELIPYQENDKWGYSNKYLEIKIPCVYDQVYGFNQGIAKVKTEGKFGLVKRNGQTVLPCLYDQITVFNGKNLLVTHAGKQGLFDSSGVEKVPCKYDKVELFDSFIRIKSGDYYGLMDHNGVLTLKIDYQLINRFTEGMATMRKNDLWGVLDASGQEIIPPVYNAITIIGRNVIRAEKNGTIAYLNKYGAEITLDLHLLFPYRKGDKWGFCNMAKEVIIAPIYDKVGPFIDGLSEVKLNGLMGYINTLGQEIIPIRYLIIRRFNDYYLAHTERLNAYYQQYRNKFITVTGIHTIEKFSSDLNLYTYTIDPITITTDTEVKELNQISSLRYFYPGVYPLLSNGTHFIV